MSRRRGFLMSLFSRSNRRTSTARNMMRIEPLEVRTLPTVNVTLSNGTATLLADQTSHDLTFEQDVNGLKIVANNGSQLRFNGQLVSQVILAGVQNLKGTFGQGADQLDFEDGVTLNNVTLNLGGGANDVEFKDGTITGALSITGGAAVDKVEFDIFGLNTVTLNLGYGDDEVEFKGMTASGLVTINTSNGLDHVESAVGTGGVHNTFLAPVVVNTGNQADEIEFRSAHFTDLTINAGADGDDIKLETVTVSGDISVDGSSGNDEIVIDGITQTGTTLNVIKGLSGNDQIKLKGATFASAVSIDLGSGVNNELEIDDVTLSGATTITSIGQSDEIKIEQDLARAGLANFVGALSIAMGPGGELKIGEQNGASFTQTGSTFNIKGSRPLLEVKLANTRYNFAIAPVLKNAEIDLV